MTSLLYIFAEPPHGRINAQEGLDALLMGTAFSECSVLFLNEGLMQLMPDQQTDALGLKDFARSYGAIKDYGVNGIYCSKSSLEKYGLRQHEFILEVVPLDGKAIRELIFAHDKVLNF